MDNLTHTLFAITLGRTPLGRAGRGTTAALVLASNAPDIDFVTTAGGAVNYLRWHRGPTHGPLGIVGLGLATAALVWAGQRFNRRWTDESPDAPFPMLVAISMIGVVFHILMDLPTSYGSRILSPFDWHWFAWDWMPIVDIYLLIVLMAGLLFGRGSAGARRRNATIVLVLMAANYGVRAVAHNQALALVPRVFGATLPPLCDREPPETPLIDRWPRPMPAAPVAGSRCLVQVAAMPTFTSPFAWRLIAQFSNAYELRDVDLLDARLRGDDTAEAPWRTNVRYPNVWTPTVEAAAATHTGQVLLGFSRFPAARTALDAQGRTMVRITDLRFVNGPSPSPAQPSRNLMFTAHVRLAADGSVLDEGLGAER